MNKQPESQMARNANTETLASEQTTRRWYASGLFNGLRSARDVCSAWLTTVMVLTVLGLIGLLAYGAVSIVSAFLEAFGWKVSAWQTLGLIAAGVTAIGVLGVLGTIGCNATRMWLGNRMADDSRQPAERGDA
jgi:hypothetical protein